MSTRWFAIHNIDDASLAWSTEHGWVSNDSYDTFMDGEIVIFPPDGKGRKHYLDDEFSTNWLGLPMHETDGYLHWTATKDEMQQLRKDYELLTKDANNAAALERVLNTVLHNASVSASDDDGGGVE